MVGRTFAAVGQMQGGGRCDGGSVRSAPETPVTLRNELRSPAERVGDVRALRKETQENCALGMQTETSTEPRWCSREGPPDCLDHKAELKGLSELGIGTDPLLRDGSAEAKCWVHQGQGFARQASWRGGGRL